MRRFGIAMLSAALAIAPTTVLAYQQLPAVFSQQSGSANEPLKITVQDPSGAIMPGAAISLVSTKTAERFTGETGEAGEFSTSLPAGEYQLTISHEEFQSYFLKSLTMPAGAPTLLVTLAFPPISYPYMGRPLALRR